MPTKEQLRDARAILRYMAEAVLCGRSNPMFDGMLDETANERFCNAIRSDDKTPVRLSEIAEALDEILGTKGALSDLWAGVPTVPESD